MVMVVKLKKLPTELLATGLCLVTVLSLWHLDHPSINSPADMRDIHRACGDHFLENYLTERDYSMDDFHTSGSLRGKGLYDFVREKGTRMMESLPRIGRNRTLDFPRGFLIIFSIKFCEKNLVIKKSQT